MPDEPSPRRPRSQGYHEYTWAGTTRYQCDSCQVDTGDEALMKLHQAQFIHKADD